MAQPLAPLHNLVREGRSDAPGRVVDLLGRIGLVGYGIVHVLVAWLALQVAFGVPDAPPTPAGRSARSRAPLVGVLALVLAAIGLVAFALWQVTAAAIGFRWVRGSERVRKRVGAVAKSIAMTALAVVVVNYLTGVRGGGEATAQDVAADVLELPAGRVLLGLVAGLILVLAGAMTYTGVRRTFMGDLDVRDLSPAARRAIELTGAIGHLARALALAVVGFARRHGGPVRRPRSRRRAGRRAPHPRRHATGRGAACGGGGGFCGLRCLLLRRRGHPACLNRLL